LNLIKFYCFLSFSAVQGCFDKKAELSCRHPRGKQFESARSYQITVLNQSLSAYPLGDFSFQQSDCRTFAGLASAHTIELDWQRSTQRCSVPIAGVSDRTGLRRGEQGNLIMWRHNLHAPKALPPRYAAQVRCI